MGPGRLRGQRQRGNHERENPWQLKLCWQRSRWACWPISRFRRCAIFGDPLTTTIAYQYQVEMSTVLSGYVVRDEAILTDDTSGLLQLQRADLFHTAFEALAHQQDNLGEIPQLFRLWGFVNPI